VVLKHCGEIAELPTGDLCNDLRIGFRAEAEGVLGIMAVVAIAALFFTTKWLGFV
jgi:hypothetical protein